jgi:hypothetical protein
MQDSTGVISSKSQINYDYAAIKITQSRIDKGLLAIPVSLSKFFPSHNEMVQIYLDEVTVSEPKQYSSYTSSTRECRIGGLREWYQKHGIKNNDEIVVQFLDKEHFVYRLIPERGFIQKTQRLQADFDSSASNEDASSNIKALSRWTKSDISTVVFNEYLRLVNTSPLKIARGLSVRNLSRARESTPSHIRTLLDEIYKGHCQVCDFWFLKRDGSPYFEIHHLDPVSGHIPKNLLVVCGNCHNQFEHATVTKDFHDGWLVNVSFNQNSYAVRQIMQRIMKRDFRKELFT